MVQSVVQKAPFYRLIGVRENTRQIISQYIVLYTCWITQR